MAFGSEAAKIAFPHNSLDNLYRRRTFQREESSEGLDLNAAYLRLSYSLKATALAVYSIHELPFAVDSKIGKVKQLVRKARGVRGDQVFSLEGAAEMTAQLNV